MLVGIARKLALRVQGSSLIGVTMRRRLLNLVGAEIHPTAIVERGCHLTSHRLRMAAGTLLNAQAFVDGTDWLILGENARVAVRATIITRTHGISDDPRRRSDHSRDFIAPVTIGAGSWIGAGCTILPGVTVASGCVVGAGAIVTKDTLPDGLYLGGGGAAKRARDL